jgi:aspartyl-tRNA(Asn)/glutamyl-tRNA(Gln) amidotransferase subunit A
LHFARPTPIFYDELDSEVAQTLERALERLRRAGAGIETIEVPEVREFEALFGRIVPVELLDILGRERVRAQFDRLDRVTQARFSAVLDAPAVDSGVQGELAALRDRVQRRISGYDAWLTPSAPLVATPLDLYGTVDAALRWNRRALRNTRPGNVFNQCGVSLPVPGATLPVGLQILCSSGEDSKLLAIASAVEEILNSPE